MQGKLEFKNEDWNHVSDEAKGIISKLVEPNAKLRYDAQQALNHPWFNLKQLKEVQPKSINPDIFR